MKGQVEQVARMLEHAIQLASVAEDWNLSEVEIDGRMVKTYSLEEQFKEALAALRSLPGPATEEEIITLARDNGIVTPVVSYTEGFLACRRRIFGESE